MRSEDQASNPVVNTPQKASGNSRGPGGSIGCWNSGEGTPRNRKAILGSKLTRKLELSQV
jgi:hypothetical protein